MSVLQYEIEQKAFSELRGKIEIPKFQRGLVWSKDKKREFIKTLKAGLPIGVLLLSKRGNKYLVIDGLQRFTTMLDYSNNFFTYIDQEEITDLDLQGIVFASETARKVYDDYKSEAKDKTLNEMRRIIIEGVTAGKHQNQNEISTAIAKELCQKIAFFNKNEMLDIQNAVFRVVSKLFNQAQIDDIVIPLIIFTGEEDELANIFQKLNQEGVKLTKYDVFAATWIGHTIKVKDDPAFIELIIKKYESAQKESGIDISNYDPDEMKKDGELTVFEYAFALGKQLMNSCPRLFNKQDDSKIDSIGFLVLAELMGLTYQNMGQLAQVIDTFKNLDFKELKDAIIDAAKFVEGALSTYIISPTKSASSSRRVSLACHSELQLASYIIVAFKLKNNLSKDSGLTLNSGNQRDLKAVKNHLYKHYLYDIIRGFWAGSGNTKMEEIISDPTTCRYMRDVDKDSFEQTIFDWLSKSNDKQEQKTVSAETKLFLNYLLRLRVEDADKHEYDIEHCVPKKVLEEYFIKKGKRVPISPACNLAYIPTSDNRGKAELTYYQKQDGDTGTYTLNEVQLDKLVYPRRSEIKFVESVDTLTEENYRSFLKDRTNTITRAFIDSLYRD